MLHPIRLAACAASLAVVGTGCGRGGGPSVAAPARVASGSPADTVGLVRVQFARGTTYALDAETGKIRWHRRVGGTLPSSPAIDGPRLLVASQDGTVTALDRDSGELLWQVQTAGKVESSPVVVDGMAFFGSHDGRVFAVSSRSGRIRWAYQTGGRINASPSVPTSYTSKLPTPCSVT